MRTLKKINMTISLLLEIAMFAALAYWGFHAVESLWLKFVLAIGAPLAAFIVWGVLLSPRAGQRASNTMKMVVSLLLFYLAALALFQARQPVLGTIMLLVAAINRTLAVIWRQW